MVTTTKKKAVKKKAVKKKAIKVNAKNAVVANKVSLTMGQAQTIANFYAKAGKKVPAFLAKKLA